MIAPPAKVAVTGGSGFIGRYLLRELAQQGYQVRAWLRSSSSLPRSVPDAVEWIPGQLEATASYRPLVADCDALVHAGLYRPGTGFRGAEGDLGKFVDLNVTGAIRLIEAARAAGVKRVVFVSTCAVHEEILTDRPLDEAHPLWPKSHYGASKAAVEKFVHSYGLGDSYPICSLRPTGVYGLHHDPSLSKWYDLVSRITRQEPVECRTGGKEVHAADVAKSIATLLMAVDEQITGQAFNCFDRYVSQWDVAQLARELTASSALITGQQTSPRHEIETGKLRALGMRFGGDDLLRTTVQQLVQATQPS